MLKNKGVYFGLLSGLTWAIDTILIGVVLSSALFLSSEQVIFLAPLVSTFLHDLLSSLWMMVFMAFRGELKTTFSKIKTRSGRWVIFGSLLGGPIGMTCYVLAVKYIGASYTASFSAIYPAVGAFMAFLILKDRLTLKNWIGLFISILFIFLLGYSSGEMTSDNYIIGFLFVLGAIFGWGMECVILAYGMKDDEISPEQALQVRQLVSAVTYGVLIMPFMKAYPLVGTAIMSKEIFFIAIIALAGTASYLFYYSAIYKIGPTRAMALNISYSAWAIILSAVFLGAPLTLKMFVFSIMILVGSVLTVAGPDEFSIKKLLSRNVGEAIK